MNIYRGPLHAGLQSVLDTALDAVIVMNVDGNVVGWNAVAEECFGWSADEVRGRRLSELIIPERYRVAHEAGIVRYLETGEGTVIDRHFEVEAQRRGGEEFPIELSITESEQFGERLFIGFLRDISDRRERAERQQRLLHESDHRVKNMLTVVAAIAQQTLRTSDDLKAFATAFLGRLDSLAEAHRLLLGRVGGDVPVTVLAEQVLGADVAAGRARFAGEEILLGPRQVLGLSMILHELYTNAVKYGALCSDAGEIVLEWTQDGVEMELVWSETGPPCDSDSHSSGFGERMIAMSARADLQGTVERDWRPEGLTVVIRFPVDEKR